MHFDTVHSVFWAVQIEIPEPSPDLSRQGPATATVAAAAMGINDQTYPSTCWTALLPSLMKENMACLIVLVPNSILERQAKGRDSTCSPSKTRKVCDTSSVQSVTSRKRRERGSPAAAIGAARNLGLCSVLLLCVDAPLF